jgi:hypothetical protein
MPISTRLLSFFFVSFVITDLLSLLQITDTITLKGPLASGKYAQEAFSGASKNPKLYKLPKCGVGKIKFRTELSIEGKKGKKGYVASEHSEQQGKEEYYGLQQGFSYDFEKCGK